MATGYGRILRFHGLTHAAQQGSTCVEALFFCGSTASSQHRSNETTGCCEEAANKWSLLDAPLGSVRNIGIDAIWHSAIY